MPAGVKWVWTWFVAVCVPASFPFVALVLLGFFASRLGYLGDSPYLPIFERLTGLGQLLPTGIALLYSGLRELSKSNSIAQDIGQRKMGLTSVFGWWCAAVFVVIQFDVILSHGTVPYDHQQLFAWSSLVSFVACAWQAANCVYMAMPVDQVASA